MPRISSAPTSLTNALDLAHARLLAPREAPKPAPPEPSDAWNKGIAPPQKKNAPAQKEDPLAEQKEIYRVAGQYEHKNARHAFLTRDEFETVNRFRRKVSKEVNAALRDGLDETDQKRLGKTMKYMDSGLEKLRDQGCRCHKMTFRGINSEDLNAFPAHFAFKENQTYADPGYLFTAPKKKTGAGYLIKTSTSTSPAPSASSPAMLMHLFGRNGTYSFTDGTDDIVFYPKNTTFQTILKAFDPNKNIYKPVMVEQCLGNEHGKSFGSDLLITASSSDHEKGLYQVATVVPGLGVGRNKLPEEKRFQNNLAEAMPRMSAHALRKLILPYVKEERYSNFKLSYKKDSHSMEAHNEGKFKTPKALADSVWMSIDPARYCALNDMLENELADDRAALLRRQLERLPPSLNVDTSRLREAMVARDNTQETSAVPATLQEAQSHLRAMQAEVKALPHVPKGTKARPPALPETPDLSPPQARQFPPVVTQELTGLERMRIARARAIEENIRSGRIYVDAENAGIAKERIQAMLDKRCPLAFPDEATYREFSQELRQLLKDYGIGDSIVAVDGTAATFYSTHPGRPVNWHFDTERLPPQMKSGLDLNITGPAFLEWMQQAHSNLEDSRTNEEVKYSVPNKKEGHLWASSVYSPYAIRLSITALRDFSNRWKEKLGCAVMFRGFPENVDDSITRDFILQGVPYRITPATAEKILKGLDGDPKELLLGELGTRPSAKDYASSSLFRGNFVSGAWSSKVQRIFGKIGPEHRVGAAVSDPAFDIYRMQHKGKDKRFLLRVEEGEIVDAKPLQPEDLKAVEYMWSMGSDPEVSPQI